MQFLPNKSHYLFKELESIRGLAALLVVLYHTPTFFGSDLFQFSLIKNGHLSVDLFFVLSGFVIFNVYSTQIHSLKSYLSFQLLRIGRLYPVHLTFFGLMIMFTLIFDNDPTFIAQKLTLRDMLNHLLLIQSIHPNHAAIRGFNVPSWSISAELFSYFVFGCVILWAKKYKEIIFSLLFLVCATLLFIKNQSAYSDILRCLSGFSLGCLTAYINQKWQVSLPKITPLVLLIVIIAFVCQADEVASDQIIMTCLSALLIVVINKSENSSLKKTLRNNKLLLGLGNMSYAIYMSHWLVLALCQRAVAHLFHVPHTEVTFIMANLTGAQTCAIYGLIVLSILSVSYWVHIYIESPARLKSRQWVQALNQPVNTAQSKTLVNAHVSVTAASTH